MARRNNKAFFGDDGASVDISQRHAGNFYGDAATEPVVKAALAARPKAQNNDGVKAKRIEDEIRGAMAGIGTTPDDEALLRQENIPSNRTNAPVPDEHDTQAEQITRYLHRQPGNQYSATYTDPDKRREFVRGLAEKLRGGPATPATQPEEQEKPFSNDDLFNSPEELKKAAKQVRPPRL